MQNILIFGAGRSSPSLIKYLLDQSTSHKWSVTIGDVSIESARQKINNHPNGRAIALDVIEGKLRQEEIAKADIVISMLPPRHHHLVAEDCVKFKKDLVTASYVSDGIMELDEDAKKAGVILLCEMGVDPGLDHMSAMKIIDNIKAKGGELTSFESYTGGLIAPESDNNPWHYKLTWNPRGVVMAGQGGVKFIQQGRYKYIPYHNIFNRIEKLSVLDCGEFEGYANRDSLKYREIYGLHDIPTIFRGTLRRVGFCKAWDIFVHIGATDDTYTMEDSENMTYRQFINSFLLYRPNDSVELKLAYHLGISIDSPEIEKLKWLGVFEETRVGLKDATPAKILQHILEQKWGLDPKDKDMIVMQHRFEYSPNQVTTQSTGKSQPAYRTGRRSKNQPPSNSPQMGGESLHSKNPLEGAEQKNIKKIHSSLVVIGGKQPFTAMSKTVGLPLGIATKLILNNQIKARGVQLPIIKEIYKPVLKELETYGIKFKVQNLTS